MANVANHGVLIGRVGKGGIKFFPNQGGSENMRLTLAVDENFLRKGKTETDTDFIPVEMFLPENSPLRNAWANVGEGDLIAVEYSIACKPYQNKAGETVFNDVRIVLTGVPKYLEPRSVTQARAKAKATTAEAPAAPATPALTPEEIQAQINALQAQQDASENPFGA